MTNAQESEAYDMLLDLEQFRRVVLLVTGIENVQEQQKMRAVVFAKTSQFKRIAYKHDISGYMQPSLRGNRLVISGGGLEKGSRHVMFHEYVHHLVKVSADVNYPAWYDEGLADMLATTHVKNDQILVGTRSHFRTRILKDNPYAVGLGRVIDLRDMNEVHGYQVGYFLGMSWALANYIHFGHLDGGLDRRPMLTQYFQMLSDSMEPTLAFEQAFGQSLTSMERQLKSYLERKNYPVLKLPQADFTYDGAISRHKMSQSEAALELVTQALVGNPKEAERLVDAALSADPENARLRSAKSLVLQTRGDFEQANQFASDAYQRDPTDAVIAINYAEVLLRWNRETCSRDQGRTADIRRSCENRRYSAREIFSRALKRTPKNPELRNAYGNVLLTEFGEYEDALRHLRFVLNYQHWNSSLHLRIGLAHHRIGDRAAAIAQLEKALYWAESERTHQNATAALSQLASHSHVKQ